MTLQKILIVIVVLALATGIALAGQATAPKAGKDKDVTKPEVMTRVDPKYPEDAKKEKVQGEVVLDAIIGADGKVVSVTAAKSPDDRLSKAAIDAVKQWTFQPAKDAKGKAVQVKSSITVKFRLS